MSDEFVEKLRMLADAAPGARRIPCLRVDTTRPGALNPVDGPEYGKVVVFCMKEALLRL